MPPCLILSIIRYGSKIKWNNPRKGVTPVEVKWLTWLPSWIFLVKASQLSLRHFIEEHLMQQVGCSVLPGWPIQYISMSGVYLWCQDDLSNTFAWVVSIHPYIHPVNGNGNHFLLVCQTTLKSTNIHQPPSLHVGVVAIEKGVFRSPSTTVANFTYYNLKHGGREQR